MPKSPNQKNRLLVLERIFLQETDEQHALTLKQLQAKLLAHDIQVERKTLYADFECLTQAGIEILRDEHDRYYTESRLFETAELKLLSDAVASSRFLTEKKSQTLIGKLMTLASKNSAHELNRNLRVAGKAKTDNEAVLYSVDALHSAIRENKQITFLYFDLTVGKQKQYRKNGARVEADLLCKRIQLPDGGGVRGEAYVHELLEALKKSASFLPTSTDDLMNAARMINDPAVLSDFIASNIFVRDRDKQAVLECFDPFRRAETTLEILASEASVMQEEAIIRRFHSRSEHKRVGRVDYPNKL